MNLFLFYSVIDRSDEIADHASQIELRDRQVRAMQAVLPSLLKGKTSRDLHFAAEKSRLEVLDKGQDEIWIENVEFRSSGGELSSVDFH